MKKFTLLIALLAGVVILPHLTIDRALAKAPLCTMTASVTATSPILCNGGSGTVTVTASGGIEPYTGTGSFTVAAGTYDYIVTDAAGCSATASITVTQPDPLVISECGCSRARCKGDTVHKSLTITGGTPPYTGAGPYILTAGVYTLTVTDANGCSGSIFTVITEPDSLIPVVTAGTIACHGGNTTVNIGATGGTFPYSSTGNYTLPQGSYDFTIYDSVGCSTNAHIDLTEPDELTILATPGPTSCATGTAVVTVTGNGGTTPYSGIGTYTVSPGVHTYDITDANGCTSSTTIYVDGPATVTANAVAGNISCNGGSTTVNVTGMGGASPYSGTGTFTVSAGTYSYTVTDAAGCSASTSVSLTEPDALNVSHISGTINCHGGTAPVTISATGGTTPYSGTGTTNYTAGTHTYTVTDANGCMASGTATLSEPSALSIAATAGTITTTGGTTTVNISATGGTTPYSGTGVFTVPAGTYTYTVTDANSCSATTSVTIAPPDDVTATASAGSINCNGGTTTITVSALGGVGPYTGTGTYTVTAGTYNYTVTDANGNSRNVSVTVSEPPALSATSIAGTITCHGGSTNVNIGATGGVTPYSGTGTYTAFAGVHSYTVTDARGCAINTTVTLTQPDEFIASATASPIICNGGSTTISLSGSGGVTPYSGLGVHTVPAGSYSYTITDANGCSSSASITVAEPPLLVATATAQPIPCFGGVTTVSVTATGGSFPYSGIGTYTTSVGAHDYVVTDLKGCTSTATININQPDDLRAHPASTSAGCGLTASNGVAWIAVSGGTTPYHYQWDAAAGSVMSDTAKNLHAGTYIVTVLDNNNCSVNTPVTVTGGAAEMALNPVITNVNCYNDNNGAIDLQVSGGLPPYHYDWSNGMNTAALENLPAGTYNITVKDNGDCMSHASVTLTQPEPIHTELVSPLYPGGFNVSAFNMRNGIVTCTTSGGTPPYSYTWSNGATTQNLQDIPAGQYTLNVTDANGCTALAKVVLKEPVPIDLPEGFSPNGDGDNDNFVVLGIENFPDNDLQIFNRWGNLVYSAENYHNTWNGTNKNDEPLPEGTYYVVLRLGKETKRAAYVELRR